MIPLAISFILVALILFWVSRRQRSAAGLPGGRIIYTDMQGWGPLEKPLYDPELGLAGKPDYLVENGPHLIPVEVKSRRVSGAPYDSHIFQLAAYCWLVERTFGKRPPYGILHYRNRTFAIDYTPQLEAALRELLLEMRSQSRLKQVNRSHQSPARCYRCGFRSNCDQALK